MEAGWGVATAKVQLGLRIDPLGLSVTSEGRGALSCPEVKRLGMLEDIEKQLNPEPAVKPTSRSARRRRLERGGTQPTAGSDARARHAVGVKARRPGPQQPQAGVLCSKFNVPPMSALDARQGYWQARALSP